MPWSDIDLVVINNEKGNFRDSNDVTMKNLEILFKVK